MSIIIMFTHSSCLSSSSIHCSSSVSVVVAVCSLYLVLLEMCLCLIFYLQSTWESRQTLHIMHIIVCWMNLYTHPFLRHHLIYFSPIHSFHLLIHTMMMMMIKCHFRFTCLLVCRKRNKTFNEMHERREVMMIFIIFRYGGKTQHLYVLSSKQSLSFELKEST